MELTVFKIGGKLVDDPQLLDQVLELVSKREGNVILVHGGGTIASRIGADLGVTPHMVEGRRITDSETLDIVVMVYAGLLNKRIVSALSALGRTSIGISGPDANSIAAHRRPVGQIDFGFVGDVDAINTDAISSMLDQGWLPVVSPITDDGQGQLLNTNGDTIASAIASAFPQIFEVTLVFLMEKDGVMLDETDEGTVIQKLSLSEIAVLKEKGILRSGMIPKIDNCKTALLKGVHKVLIGSPRSFREKKATLLTL